jgi:hypothetical protein
MTADKANDKSKVHAARSDANATKRVKERVQSQDPRACVDEKAAPGKSPDQQRRESRLEVGRPKDSGRCGA